MRTVEECKKIYECWQNKFGQTQTSKYLNLPRSTIKDYFNRFDKGAYPNWQQEEDLKSFDESPCGFESHRAYSYILGCYLGDGYINKYPRTYKLRIFSDKKYPNIIAKQKELLAYIFPKNRVTLYKHGENCIAVTVHSQKLVTYFPQHGIGRKHDRTIELKLWQKEIVTNYPKEFIEGLIVTDGCRFDRKSGDKKYPNYSFSNRSKEIRELFIWACSLVGVKITQTGYDVNICTRKEVEILDTFIGQKS